jgi:hypothetical protein
VSAVGHDQLVVVAGKLQSRRQILITQWPVAVQVVQIFATFLQIHLDRLRLLLRLANKAGIGPAATDVGEAPDMTEHFAELIGLFPGHCERADGARRDSADGSISGIDRHVQPPQRDGQEFVDQKIRGAVAGIVPGFTNTAMVTGIAFC